MLKIKSSLKYALILWIVGLFPFLFDVILRVCTNDAPDELFEAIFIAVCNVIGGLLCLYVADKECSIQIKAHSWRIQFKPLLLTVLLAVCWIVSIAGTLLRNSYDTLYGANERVPWQIFVSAALITPIGEELIYRYAIFSVLKGDGTQTGKTICAVFISSVMFMITHFSFTPGRIADLLLFGILAALIFHFTNNLIYSIVFHGTANFTTYALCDICQTIRITPIILIITIPLAVLCLVALIRISRKADRTASPKHRKESGNEAI